MEKEIDLKLEALQKYVPYIDFVIGIDSEKYVKFVDIKNWIINKKRLPLSDLNKIEQSMTTSYKNMILLDKKIPQNIAKVFYTDVKHRYVNLCSDDEEEEAKVKQERQSKSLTNPRPSCSGSTSILCSDDEEEEAKVKQERQSKSLTNPRPSCSGSTSILQIDDDSDDDIELVSITPNNSNKPATKSTDTQPAPDNVRKSVDATDNMLIQIDDITWQCDASEYPNEPKAVSTATQPAHANADESTDVAPPMLTQIDNVNCKYIENTSNGRKKYYELLENKVEIKEEEELLFQRRPRKSEFTAPEATNIKMNDMPEGHVSICDTVLLDSSDDDYDNGDNDTKFRAGYNNRTVLTECNNKEAVEEQFKNLTTDEMLKIISSRIPNLDYEQLQRLYQQVPPNTPKENHLPSSSSSESSEQNEASSGISPVSVGPRIEEPSTGPELFIKTMYEFLDKMMQPGSHAPERAPTSILPLSTSPEQYQQQHLHYPQQAPLHMDRYYNNIQMQNSSFHQPMYPNAYTHMNQNTVPPYNPAPASSVPASLKARDPRAKSLSYQKSYQILHTQMQERLSLMQANNFPQSNPQPTHITNNSFNSIHQPMTAPATLVAAQQQQQHQQQSPPELNRTLTGIEQPNGYSNQQRYAPENHATTSAQAKKKKSTINYGEYKRRKIEEEQKRIDEEKQRKESADMRKKEEQCKLVALQTNETTCRKDVISEVEETPADVHSILFDILQPYQDKIKKSWNAKNDVETNNTREVPKATNRNINQGEEKPKETATEDQRDRISNRMNRLYKEMECTLNGYDKLPTGSSGKRRSSIHARSVISEQLNSSQESQTIDADELHKPVNKSKRRNSLHGSQYNQTTDDNQQRVGKKRRSSVHPSLNEDASTTKLHSKSPAPCSELRRSSVVNNNTDTETIMLVSDDKCSVQSSDSETTDFERFRISKANKMIELTFVKQAKVVLKRLTEESILQHTKMNKSVLDVKLIESGIRTDKERSLTNATATAAKKSPLKKCNNDCIMTERNTKFCVLCSSKPSDLTSHYKRKHKSESYVSRLSWSELDDLCINTPFANLISSRTSKIERYEVLCPFCEEKLQMPFMNLYNHYSSHTGEYAFQCSGCQLDKPFRADIQSHQLHAKNCRNSQIQTMYRYQSNAMSIYLHYCTICNFVQLNEANVLKHLREHHDPRKATADNVQKCILAAISDGPESNSPAQHETDSNATQQQESTGNSIDGDKETMEEEILPEIAAPPAVQPKLEIKPNLDDDIPVFNEACAEDSFDLEERLKELHEGHITKQNAPLPPPMTVIPLGSLVSSPGTVVNKEFVPKYERSEFKTEAIEVADHLFSTSPRVSTIPKKSYTKNVAAPHSIYREYPANVNYLGFYKCMAGDCFYSSDVAEEFATHMEGHQQDNLHINYLQCPYCILPANSCQSANQLVEHLNLHHAHMVYQCSMCCYRSCEALYVQIHQREKHPSHLEKCAIYKCSGEEAIFDISHITENMTESVSKIKCPYCSNSYYNTHILMLHISTNHISTMQNTIRKYSCIYCSFWDSDQLSVQKHTAIHHPGELPYYVDHNLTTVTEDALHNLQPLCFSEPVPTYDARAIDVPLHEKNEENIKPSVEELIRTQADCVKVRLRKLTEKTGVPPDCLYRCSDQTCGGFFSVYNLWLRHMRGRHRCLETRCPHCTVETIKPLEEFAFHFETHRLHTYICFHCPLTTTNAENAQDHWLKEHSDLGQMHVEQIRFNLNYSYYIMIQSNKFQNQMEFLGCLSELLDRRIQELKDNEASKLNTMWLVSDSPFAVWLEDFPKYVFSPKIVKKCFNGNCDYRSACDNELFEHVKTTHNIVGRVFKCSKCDFSLEETTSWDIGLNHIKQHSETSCFICGACNKYYLCRSKISEHIRLEHSARDVPIVNLTKTEELVYSKVAIVFANERLTFSTMRNCFCCEERSISGNGLMLHLKRYHNFIFFYFCEWCNLPIDSLQSIETHYKENHTRNKMKIRCELASKDNLSVLSITDFKIQISSGLVDGVKHHSPIIVKQEEPDDDDDSIIIMEDDDVIAENFEKSQNLIDESANKPKLKCIAMENLLNSNCSDRLRVRPKFKIVNAHRSSIDCNNKTKTSATNKIPPRNITDSVISSARVVVTMPQVSTGHTSMSNPMTNTSNNIVLNLSTSNTIAQNQYESMPRIGTTVNHGNASNFSYPTTTGGAISGPFIYNTNSMNQSTANYSSSSSRTVQNVRACNSGSFSGPITTAFLNSEFLPPPAPPSKNTAVGQTNVYTYQNIYQASSVNTTANTSMVSNMSQTSTTSATLPHPVVSTYSNAPSSTIWIRTPTYAVPTSAVAALPNPAMHQNLNLQSSISSINSSHTPSVRFIKQLPSFIQVLQAHSVRQIHQAISVRHLQIHHIFRPSDSSNNCRRPSRFVKHIPSAKFIKIFPFIIT